MADKFIRSVTTNSKRGNPKALSMASHLPLSEPAQKSDFQFKYSDWAIFSKALNRIIEEHGIHAALNKDFLAQINEFSLAYALNNVHGGPKKVKRRLQRYIPKGKN